MSKSRETRTSSEGMTLALRDRCESICEVLAEVGPKDTRLRYRIGVLVKNAQTRPSKYGEHAVEQISRCLGYGSKTLYHYAAVSAAWTPNELKRVLAQRSTSNLPLRWSHIALLATIEAPRRDELVQEVLKKNLSPAGLKRLLGNEPKRSPRPRKLPDAVLVKRGLRSVSGMLRTLKRLEADCLPAVVRQPMDADVSGKLDEVLANVDARIRHIRASLVRGRPTKRTPERAAPSLVDGGLQ